MKGLEHLMNIYSRKLYRDVRGGRDDRLIVSEKSASARYRCEIENKVSRAGCCFFSESCRH